MEVQLGEVCGAEAGVESLRIVSLVMQGLVCCLIKIVGVCWYEVRQVAPLGMVPKMFDRIEVGSVAWQPFDAQPGGRLFPE